MSSPKICQHIKELRSAVRAARNAGQRIGFVPTMGYLHEGHLSLIRRARAENDVVVVSIFVNPTQFGPNEDLDAYPRDADRDLALLAAEKVDVLFMPDAGILYPDGYATYVNVEGKLTGTLCGSSRPGHFRGVATIVAKLFNLVAPDRAYFGQKDAQQIAVIERMVRDLDMNLEIVVCPIVREADGLALSSRNAYLTAAQRRDAVVLSRSLDLARKKIDAGERSAGIIEAAITEMICAVDSASIDYVALVDASDLQPLQTLSGKVLIALAVRIGTTRLIDNMTITI